MSWAQVMQQDHFCRSTACWNWTTSDSILFMTNFWEDLKLPNQSKASSDKQFSRNNFPNFTGFLFYKCCHSFLLWQSFQQILYIKRAKGNYWIMGIIEGQRKPIWFHQLSKIYFLRRRKIFYDLATLHFGLFWTCCVKMTAQKLLRYKKRATR